MKTPLTEAEKIEILQEHIPYKLTQLRHHHYYKELYRDKFLAHNRDIYRKHEICAIEIAFVSGRLFLEFLGIGYDSKKNQIIERRPNQIKDDDLFIMDFMCEPVKLSSLSIEECNTLSTFYNRANKGSGHFTWQKREIDGWESVDNGTVIIESLLKAHLYDKLNMQMKEK